MPGREAHPHRVHAVHKYIINIAWSAGLKVGNQTNGFKRVAGGGQGDSGAIARVADAIFFYLLMAD